MSYLLEYISKRMGAAELETELLRLIGDYNRLRNTYLFLYVSATTKQIPLNRVDQSDYYVIRDILHQKKGTDRLDIYIQTLGGQGEAAEEIVRFLHSHFPFITFVVAGEAKSAGTLIVLSGNEIMMTDTGSLGPIDAQVQIGRSVISAHDYTEWVKEKRDEASKTGALNPFDATMIAQITPGELGSVLHSLKFAQDLVVEWLTNYKFENWNITEGHGRPVTEEMKRQRAQDIAEELTKHSRWRSHGRSLKLRDLVDDIQLKIDRVDDNSELSDIVYRIHTVLSLLFDSTTIYKIFATADSKIFKHATQGPLPIFPGQPIPMPGTPATVHQADMVQIDQKCPKCGTQHLLYAKLKRNPKIDADLQAKGFKPFPRDAKLQCSSCGFEMDLMGMKNEIETRIGKKIIE